MNSSDGSSFLPLDISKGEMVSVEASGKVYLVGAGPGDPGLLTIRGAECLGRADYVLYDGLANPQLLQWAPQANHICVGKHGQGRTRIWSQHEIDQAIVSYAKQGFDVVRLKGGDPAIFARTAEELQVLQENGIKFEVVPGITAALAVASYVGIPITNRDCASAVALVTGQQQGEVNLLDWQALANFPGTLVLYMAVTTAGEWTSQLINFGKSPDTAVTIIRGCTLPDQSVWCCTLGEVSSLLGPNSSIRPPAIVIVGQVAELAGRFDWFTSRQLHGCGVWVTRPMHQAKDLCAALREFGANVFVQPLIEIVPPLDLQPMNDALSKLRTGAFSGVTFASANAVDGLIGQLQEQGGDARAFAGCWLGAVGAGTARRLAEYGLRADVIPDKENSNAFGLSRMVADRVAGQACLVTTTNGGRDTLARELTNSGAIVTVVEAYHTAAVTGLTPDILMAIEQERLHMITITSCKIARIAHQLLGKFSDRVHPISLSSQITKCLEELSWPAIEEAEHPNDQSMVEATVMAWQKLKIAR
ncbi:MAG: uroporphyrinogen-III C-methyltransferase [Planctomycetales bacterium]|nr:uroporphyrinogen-III C-methyltransferase [Planctomycetales bacterium]